MQPAKWVAAILLVFSVPQVALAQSTDEPTQEETTAVEEEHETEPGVLRYGDVVLRPELKLYADFEMDVSDDDLANAFHISRAYIGFRATITDWLSGRITYDVTHAKDLGSSGSSSVDNGEITIDSSGVSGSELGRLKYGYIDLAWSDLNLHARLGIVQTPWIGWIEHIEDTRFLRKVMIENEYHYPSADFGLTLLGEVGDMFAYHLGVYNGCGYHGVERSEGKDVIGRLSLRPLPEVDGFEGLVLSGYAQVEVAAPDDGTHRRFGGALTYRLADEITSNDSGHAHGETLAAWIQTFMGQDGPNDAFVDSFGLSVGTRVELPEDLFIIGRLDRFDPNMDVEEDTIWTVIGAFGVRPTHGVIIAIDYQGRLSPDGDENVVGLHTEWHL